MVDFCDRGMGVSEGVWKHSKRRICEAFPVVDHGCQSWQECEWGIFTLEDRAYRKSDVSNSWVPCYKMKAGMRRADLTSCTEEGSNIIIRSRGRLSFDVELTVFERPNRSQSKVCWVDDFRVPNFPRKQY